MRLPDRLVLPFGYVITFKYVTVAEMKELSDGEVDGLWDSETQTIYVRKRLPAKRLRYIVAHELDHAVNDYRLALVNTGVAQG